MERLEEPKKLRNQDAMKDIQLGELKANLAKTDQIDA